MTPEETSRVSTLRAKVLAGTATREEMVEGIRLLRQGRIGASIASEKSRRSRAKAEVPTADELIAEMEAMK